jgi:hypothetical protein
MEKTIFISVDNDTPLTFLSLCIQEESVIRLKAPAYLCVLGLVNQHLSNMANAKEIVKVEYENSTYLHEPYAGYVVTYLESEMIATKSDLQESFEAGTHLKHTKTDYPTWFPTAMSFESWFSQNF